MCPVFDFDPNPSEGMELLEQGGFRIQHPNEVKTKSVSCKMEVFQELYDQLCGSLSSGPDTQDSL